MGNRLVPAALLAMGEEVSSKSMLDRLDRLEQLGWLPSSDEWMELRRIRNELTHEHPDTVVERFQRLGRALASARRLSEYSGELTTEFKNS
jgi:DnaJ-domain-containing protein 1